MSLLSLSLVAILPPLVVSISLSLWNSVYTTVHTHKRKSFHTFLGEFLRVINCTFGAGVMRFIISDAVISARYRAGVISPKNAQWALYLDNNFMFSGPRFWNTALKDKTYFNSASCFFSPQSFKSAAFKLISHLQNSGPDIIWTCLNTSLLRNWSPQPPVPSTL